MNESYAIHDAITMRFAWIDRSRKIDGGTQLNCRPIVDFFNRSSCVETRIKVLANLSRTPRTKAEDESPWRVFLLILVTCKRLALNMLRVLNLQVRNNDIIHKNSLFEFTSTDCAKKDTPREKGATSRGDSC